MCLSDSWGPGHDPDGGLSSPPDVLVLLRSPAPLLQEGELLQQEATASWSFSEAGQSPQGVHDEGLPPPPPLLILVFLRYQLEEDGDEAQVQTLLLACRRRTVSHTRSASDQT